MSAAGGRPASEHGGEAGGTGQGFWLERGAGGDGPVPGPALAGEERADVVVVGGGLSGLWAAHCLKDADGALDVAVLEQSTVGSGASGRSVGVVTPTVGRSLSDLLRKAGPTRTRATHLASLESLGAIERFCQAEGVEASRAEPGLLTVSTSAVQDQRIAADLRAANRLGLDDMQGLDATACRDLVAAAPVRCGHLTTDSLLVDPAALCQALAGAARRRGIRVYEQSAVSSLDTAGAGVEARTPEGRVRAGRALLATNAYAWSVPPLRRYLVTLVIPAALTKPLTDYQWEALGWRADTGVEDKRIMPGFWRRTADGRMLVGGGDALYAARGPANAPAPSAAFFERLESSAKRMFPQLSNVPFEACWSGPVCATVNGFSTVGWLAGERIAYALGYSAHGLGQSHLAGRVAADLLLERRTDVLELPLVSVLPRPLPPGPLAAPLVSRAVDVLRRVDDGEIGHGPMARLALRLIG